MPTAFLSELMLQGLGLGLFKLGAGCPERLEDV